MDLLSFFQRLNGQGVKLVLKDGSLSVKSNKKVSQELLLEIKSNKELIIDYLKKYQGENANGLQEKYGKKDTKRTLLESIKPFDRKTVERIPLSFSQDRLWFLDQFEGTLTYHLPSVIRLEGDLDVTALEQSLKTIIARHEVLRTNLMSVEGIGYQEVVSEENWSLDQVKITKEELLKTTLHDYINIPFDLSNHYKLRACLYDLGSNKYVLACVFHHIASDGWSSNILVGEFVELYSSLRLNRKPKLPELTLQYTDYAMWQRTYLEGEVLENQLSYWQEKLKGVSTLELPKDYARPATQSTRGAYIPFKLNEEVSSSLKAICQEEGVTLFMLMLSAFKVLLSRYSGQDDISVGTPVANRTQSELEGMIGFFVNTLALRSDLSENPSFRQLLNQVKQTTLESYDNQLAPFERVVDRVVKTRDVSTSPLFQVMFVLQNTPASSETEIDGVVLSGFELEKTSSKFDFTMHVSEGDTDIFLGLEYCTDLFSEATINRMLTHYQELLRSIVKDMDRPVKELPIITKEEEAKLLNDFNETFLEYPENESIVEVFESQVRNTPSAIAVSFGEETLTYKELDERSNQLAHYLKTKDVESNTYIGICMDRSLEMIIGILGVLKSGGAYVPIDSEYPEERIDYMISDASIGLILVSETTSKIFEAREEISAVSLDSNWSLIAEYPTTRLNEELAPSSLAYVIYTSGSTGKPKGVQIEHKSVVSLATSCDYVSLDGNTKWLSTGSISFDATTIEYWGTLLNGGELVLTTSEILLNISSLKELIATKKVTTLWMTASWFHQVVEEDPSVFKSLQYLLVGGDVVLFAFTNRLKKLYPELTIINGYGPTENTTFSTTYSIEATQKAIPIGKPIKNSSAYIVDNDMKLAPIGIVGELLLGGSGVARGYLNNQDLTNEKFVGNPFKVGDRLYKTGDLARWLPDGNIEFIGRKDHQVKIRGYRIELGEIENTLSSLEAVNQSCVLAKEDVNGNKRLIGYVVVNGEFNKENIQDALKESLPDYMVPNLWVQLDSLPLTSNGKLDRKALPEPDNSELSTVEYLAPRNDVEEQLVTIWQGLLKVEKIGVQDDFFELGGHSLLVVQLIAQLQKNGFYITVKDIFSNPTIAAIAEKVSLESPAYKVPENGIKSDTDRIAPEMLPLLNFSQEDIDTVVSMVPGGVSNIQDIYPLSPLQEGMYFHYLMSDKEQGDPYVLTNLLAFNKEEKRSSFIEALQFVVNRHDVLRTCVLSENLPRAIQVVQREVELSLEKIVIDNDKDILSELKILTEGSQWMDASNAPLLKLKLVDDRKNGNYYLWINQHHIIFDHVGLEIIISEIQLYISGNTSRLSEPVLYRDFIGHTLHLQETNNSESYFRKVFGGISESTYPFGLSDIQGSGSNIKETHTVLPEELSKEIRSTSTKLGISPAVLFHAAFGVVVGRCSNTEYAIFGSLLSGRLQGSLGAADSLGLFINTLPFYTNLDRSVSEYISEVKNALGELLSHEQTPLSSVQGWSGVSNEVPLFSALLNYRHSATTSEEEVTDSVDLGLSMVEANERTNYPLSIDVDDYGSDFGLKAQVDGGINGDNLLSYITEAIKGLLKGLKSEEEIRVSEINILSETEESQLLETFNATKVDYPLDKTFVDLFADQVQKSPEAIAAIFADQKITYKELDERSNQLAHCLIEKGITSNTMVGICLERSLDMLIGVLGILKSGAAYVPMKPDFPQSRIAHILEDLGHSFVVTNVESKPVFSSMETIDLVLLDDSELQANYPITSLEKDYNASDLAYVIYTSGSTGLPKGAMIEHAGLLNHLFIMVDDLEMDTNSTVAFTAPFTFDISVWQMLSGLLCGGRVAIYSEEDLLAIDEFQNSLTNNTVSHLQLVPSYVSSLLENSEVVPGLSDLAYFLVTGEAATKSLLDKWFSLYPNVPVVNAYGPAEASDDITLHIMNESPTGAVVPIGKPVANMDVYVVDSFDNLCPIGVVGELWTAGIGVGRGYLNREELTKEKFIENPFKPEGGRLYKTGDLGRWLPNGTIEFVGRSDDQVKIRGYRIELGEIENALSVISGVQSSCVLAKKGPNGVNRLVGYVVMDTEFDKGRIQDDLLNSLPEYMVPALWVELDEMPLTANGKIDKKVLPEPDGSLLSTTEYVAPRNETEAQIATIWQELLGIESIGIYDNFFEIGGHSLLIIQLISQLQKIDFHISVKDIFSNPTIASVSEKLSSGATMYQVPANGITENIDRIVPSMVPLLDFEQEDLDKVVSSVEGGVSNVEDIYPLSPLQEGIYFHHLMSNPEEGDPYVLPHLLSFPSKENRDIFIKGLQFVVDRHDVLRTCVISEGLPKAVQVVLRQAKLSLECLELDSSKDVLSELKRLTIPGNQWVDVSKAPLLKLQSADDVKNDTYYLVLLEHHLTFDHVGVEKIIEEIGAYLTGNTSNLAKPALYRDFIGHTLHQQATNDSSSYFTNLLGSIDTPSYPFDLSNIHTTGASIKESVVILPQELNKEIRNTCMRTGMSPATLFHAAYGLVIGKCSNMNYAIFGTLFSGRLQGSTGAADSLGLFINTLPFYIALEGTITEYVETVKQQLVSLLPYEQTPLSHIQAWSGVSNEVPLFSALLNFRHSAIPVSNEEEADAIDLGIKKIGSQERTNYPFTLNVDDYGVDFGITAQVEDHIDADRVLNYMQEALEQLVKGLNSEETIEVSNAVILPKEEEQLLLDTFNNTEADYPSDKIILDVFSDQVKQSPNQIAVVYKGKELSYKELDQRSNQVARYLQAEGVKTDDLVGICMTRSLEMIVGILGVLKSGGAYVPIDPNYPKERISYIIEDTGIELVLSNAASHKTLEGKKGLTNIALDTDWNQISEYSTRKPSYKSISQDNLAYVIYTSGSTGKPKGVLIEHGNMFNLVNWAIDNFTDSLDLGMLASTSINFDLSVFEIFTSLASGAKIELVDNLLSLVEDLEVSVSLINTVPSVLLGILESGKLPETVKTINLAGEPLLPSLVDRIYNESSVEAIYDLYGPSEATTYSTFIKREVNGVQTIGRPVANTQIYILSESSELVPVGVMGELCVGGKGVARGYLNQEELTNEKFVPNPFKEGERIYKTGDLARWLPDGTLEYVGRKDSQVKVRGYRIELGEIETALASITDIQNGCVLAKEDITGSKRLVGYVVTDGEFNKEKVQAELKESLPEYMVPGLWVELEEMPLTASGKLDRKALPELDGSLISTKEYVAPRTVVEEQIATIWQDILGLEKVGIYDNFFELGGHSLLVVQLISRLQKLDLYIEVKDIFSNPTIEEIAEKLSSDTERYQVPVNGILDDTDYIVPAMVPLLDFSQEDIDTVVSKVSGGVSNIQDIYPLSPLQEGIYFHHLMSDKEQGDPYVLSNLLSFKDAEKRALFIEALQFVVNRHDVLRTSFINKDLPKAVQVVQRKAELPIEKLVFENGVNILSELQNLTAPGSQWMDVSNAPLLTLKSADDKENTNFYLIVNQHHLVLDHVGMEKIVSEIVMYLSGKEEQLSTPVLYRNFIGHTLHAQATNNSESYFTGLLADIEEPTYPFHLSNTKVNASQIKESNVLLSDALNTEIREVSTSLGMSPAVLFHAAYGLVVGKCSNSEYALFGSLFSGRLQGALGAADSLGLFINTLPFYTSLEGTVSEYIHKVKQQLNELLPYEQTPLASIQGWSGISNEVAFFSALLNYRHSHLGSEEIESDGVVDLGLEVIGGDERTNYPFTLNVDDFGESFGLTAQIKEDIDSELVLAYMQEALTSLLNGLRAEGEELVTSLDILSQEEKSQILEVFNATELTYPSDKSVVALFEDQAQKTPEAIAISFGGSTLTYQELDKRSNQLTHYLQKQGIQTGAFVGICMDRSLELIVAILGVLKSGGAYVPIDPNYPQDRIDLMLNDASINWVLSSEANSEVIAGREHISVIALDQQWDELISTYSTNKVNQGILPSDLAYVIYTSGSTGRPKGVQIEHKNIVSLSTSSDYVELNSNTVWLSTGSISFDATTIEYWGTLLNGGELVLTTAETLLQTASLKALIHEKKVTTLWMTASWFHQLVEEDSSLFASLKYLLVGGDVVLFNYTNKIKEIYPELTIINGYGPTENTTFSTTYTIEITDKSLPIGKPLKNRVAYIVDEAMNLVPVGVEGELVVGGAGVARGYLNNDELTKEKFVASPFNKGERLYKTGDLVKWLPDGNIEFVGRKDAQVKIRGYRIELGEIENTLSNLNSISQCCVLAKETANGTKHLVGYVVSEDAFDKEAIQLQLKEHLPDYMIPSIWVKMDEMPLTSNGKLDRKALPEPDRSDLSSKDYVAPRNETEEKLVAIWQELLEVEKIGVHDNFFELGGNSLLVTRLVSLISKEFKIEVMIKDIFSFVSIDELGTYLDYKKIKEKESSDKVYKKIIKI
ncbi:amino acid adenylation domain-containing protein [Tenacibaculum xiamenense]|uniref:amino acid adenylation domain-containing protein n=1 Tax=Tenacibaculum xiamenense TaxID=1261553 RepID=UPI0038950073